MLNSEPMGNKDKDHDRAGKSGKGDDYFSHWADYAARATAEKHKDRHVLVVAAGITPSGTVHIGNFREVITVDLVARALRDRGVNVRFIYSWDDFDVFRKVPAGMPEQAFKLVAQYARFKR